MPDSAAPTRYRQIFAHRAFTSLWIGQTVSNFGDTLYDVALLWYVLGATGSALDAGAIAVASRVGRLVGSAAASGVLDRTSLRRTMLLAESTRLLLTTAVGALWSLGFALSLPMLYSLAFLTSAAGAFFGPARAAAIPRLVKHDELVTANSLDGLSTSLTNTLAWAGSGVVVAILGPANALLADAATFLVSLSGVLLARWDETTTTDVSTDYRTWTAFAGGYGWIWRQPLMRLVFITGSIQALAAGFFVVSIAPFLEQHFHAGATLYGIQGAAFGVGVMLAAWVIGSVAVRRVGSLYAAGIAVNAISNCAFALSPVRLAVLPAVFFAGWGNAALTIGELSLLQQSVPAELRGRVFATLAMAATATLIPAMLVGGWLADRWQAEWIMLLASLVHLTIGLGLFCSKRLRSVGC
jgi:MFS transporter, DHA3 family, macrolide efflux protein